METRLDVEFARNDERFKAVDVQLADLKTGQAQMNARFESLEGRSAVGGKFDAMQRTLVQVGFSLVVGLLGGLVVLIGVIVTLMFTQ